MSIVAFTIILSFAALLLWRSTTLGDAVLERLALGWRGRALALIREAHGIALQIPEAGERGRASGDVARALARAEKFPESRALIGTIHDQWVKSNAVYGVLLEIAKTGNVEQTRAAAEAYVQEAGRGNTLLLTTMALARARRIRDARRLSTGVDDPCDRAAAQVFLAVALADSGKPTEADASASGALKTIDEATRRHRSCPDDTLGELVNLLLRLGRIERTPAIANLMGDYGRAGDALILIMRAAAQARAATIVQEAAQDALAHLRRIPQPNYEDRATWRVRVVAVLTDAGLWAEAHTVADALRREYDPIDTVPLITAARLIRIGRWDEARQLARDAKGYDVGHAILSRVAGALARSGKLPQALGIAGSDLMAGGRFRDEAYQMISDVLVETKHFEEAKALAARLSNNENALRLRIGESLLAADHTSDAWELTAMMFWGSPQRSTLTSRIARKLVESNRTNEAITLARKSVDPTLKVQGLTAVAIAIFDAQSR